jgi:hypothetical protein
MRTITTAMIMTMIPTMAMIPTTSRKMMRKTTIQTMTRDRE